MNACLLLVAVLGALGLQATPLLAENIGDQKPISFNADIRPILSENCFHCHGPDGENRAADLRLDEREAAIDYGAITPGEPDESAIIDRVNATDPDIVMPPPETHKTLTAEQKKRLTDWIAQGAKYQRHWAFEPIVAKTDGSIDEFINAKLTEKQLAASPAASRERWLRRVTLDLTGLPPTVDEIDDFLADQKPGAFEQVVDRLLASPTYGERMATEWLDVARYSDTYGYQVDRDRFVWPWRDWVIKAFNDNLPYDDFITQQLAGDLLPEPTEEQILATTFNRLNPQKVEGGSVEEEFRVEYVVDRAQTVSTAFLGLTFECSRCHDHKFDPLTQKEFYELNAFFANINEAGLYSFHTESTPTPTLPLPTDDQRAKLAELEEAVTKAEQELEQARDAVRSSSADKAAPLEPIAGPTASLTFDEETKKKLKAEIVDGVVGKAAKLSGDDGLPVGPAAFKRSEPFTVSLWLQTPDVKDRAVVFHRSLGWTDAASRGYQLLIEEGKLSAALVHFWPGNAINVRTAEPIPTGEWLHVAMTYDGSSRAKGLRLFINGQPAKTEVAEDSLTKTIVAGEKKEIEIGRRDRDRGFTNGLVDEFEVYNRELTTAEVAQRFVKQPLENLLSIETLAKLPDDQAGEVIAKHADAKCSAALEKLKTARLARDQLLDDIKDIMVMQELPELRETYVLDRGVYDARKERVSPGTPASLPPMPAGEPRNRLGLAKWLTSPEHPLTARVAVNRYWQMVFGRGLVVTTEDFGSQGTPPTHPELLDWLAKQFIDSGWDVKALLKTMVLSEAYRRDSKGVEGSETKDSQNLWLARGPASPMTAEMIRDAALATSGLLSDRIGGKPAKPYELAVSFKPIETDKGEGLYRRSLYTYWKRTAPAPVMLVLDASTRDVCRVRRERTSSPLQAMVLLNGPQYVEAAQAAAARVLTELGNDTTAEQRLTRLFRQLTSRAPNEQELAILIRLHEQQQKKFADDSEAVKKYLTVGEFKEPIGIDQVELSSLAIVAQAVMNLDECLMKR